jgi:hypothetical protein
VLLNPEGRLARRAAKLDAGDNPPLIHFPNSRVMPVRR